MGDTMGPADLWVKGGVGGGGAISVCTRSACVFFAVVGGAWVVENPSPPRALYVRSDARLRAALDVYIRRCKARGPNMTLAQAARTLLWAALRAEGIEPETQGVSQAA